jgi:hypothetical protein
MHHYIIYSIMQVLLHDGTAHVQIVPRSRIREFRDPAAALEFLRPLMLSARNLAAVRAAAGAAAAASDADVAGELARRIVAEGLQVVRCGDELLGAGAASTVSSQQAAASTPLQDEEAAAADQAPPAETHWIEIELLDDAGKPVANELYVVELPDGSAIQGRTGSDGRARVDGVDPGTAKVSFPDLDKSSYTPK